MFEGRRPPWSRRRGIPPRPDGEQTARVLRTVELRHRVARALPVALILVAVGMAALLTTPRRYDVRQALSKLHRPAKPGAAPQTSLSSDGTLDLTVHDGEQQRTLRLERGKSGWLVQEYPPGTKPAAPPSNSAAPDSASPPGGAKP